MSYRTNLGLKYSDASQVAETLNSEILLLKKDFLANSELEPVAKEKLDLARSRLSKFLHGLAKCLMTRECTASKDSEIQIPDELVKRLDQRHRARLEYFLQDLETVSGILQKGGSMTAENVAVLDDVANAADESASASFRRLWRR